MEIDTFGLQTRLARKLKVSRQTMNGFFTGKHTPTAKMAEQLETEFNKLGIPITRWDLLWGNKDRLPLADYLKTKQAQEN